MHRWMTELSAGFLEGSSFAGLSRLRFYERRLPTDGPLHFKTENKCIH